jgi:hypothetical protein
MNKVPSSNLAGVTYGAGLFAAAGDSGILSVSADGMEWTLVPSPTTNALRSILYAGSQFIAIGNKGTIVMSPDGIDWRLAETGLPKAGLIGAAYGDGIFVVGAYDTTINTGLLITSTNGANWQVAQSSMIANSPYYGVAYGGGKFVAVGSRVMSSTDAVNWRQEEFTGAPDVFPQRVTYADGKFVIVGYGHISYSSDGQHWTNVSLPISSSTGLFGITFGGRTFVAVGQDGTILQSAPLTDFHLASPLSYFSINGAPGLHYRIQASTNLALLTWIGSGRGGVRWSLHIFR